eukprot:m.100719 g.100719  ORF g.100719 m.100719 type:complete len:111 (+) comp12554_c0_seq12:79-411(+)
MAEVFFIGNVDGGEGFSGSSLYCQWRIVAGNGWSVIAGSDEGQTQIDHPTGDDAVWAHPIDIHYKVQSIQGWPRMSVQVFTQDSYGRHQLGWFCHNAVYSPCFATCIVVK